MFGFSLQRTGYWFRRALIALGVFVLAVFSAEIFCRFCLGLGDPPLLQTDPQIEYLYQPSRTYHRFGNVIRYNAYSMRSDDFPLAKSHPDELRLLVLSDSVITGDAQIDQKDLATEILRRDLQALLNRPVIVGNVSAGSWGPGNLLAYVRKFGWFDADLAILVLSCHDHADHPTFQPWVGVAS